MTSTYPTGTLAYISTICTIVVDGLFIWKDIVLCAISMTSSFE
jgi:hypothetical protein